MNRIKTAVQVKKKEPNIDKINRSKRIISGTRLAKFAKHKKLVKTASQPGFEKFSQRKASYISYVKSSKIQVTLKQEKKKKNSQSLSRANNMSSLAALRNKRKSADQNIKSINISSSRIQTPQNMIVSRVPKKLKKRQVPSVSSSRNPSSNYRKLRVNRRESSEKSIVGIEHKFQTVKVKSSRNRSVTSGTNFISSNRLNSSNILAKKFSLKDSSEVRLNTEIPPKNEALEAKHHQILTVKDLNNQQVSLENSDLKDCNFTMTDESEVNTQNEIRKKRNVK